MKNSTFESISKAVNKGEVFYIFPHIVMDGDALGSATALCRGLRQLGKKAYIVKEDGIAKNISFLAKDFCIDVEDAKPIHDVSICVDCSEKSRFPKRAGLFDKGQVSICIDHHKTAEYFCDYNYIDADAAATAELVYKLLLAMGVTITEEIAKSIFTGITTDTGNFQYSNTTGESHKIVAALYDICDDFNDVSIQLYENDSFERLELQSKILGTAKRFIDDKLIIANVTQDMLRQCNAVMDDSEGSVSKLRAIEGVEIAVLLRENADGTVKASMRAKTTTDVATICQKFGGGGHVKAAGFTVTMSLDEITELIKKEVEKSLG